jgi:hypothetical protein
VFGTDAPSTTAHLSVSLQLHLESDERVTVTLLPSGDYYMCEKVNGSKGKVPIAYIQLLSSN